MSCTASPMAWTLRSTSHFLTVASILGCQAVNAAQFESPENIAKAAEHYVNQEFGYSNARARGIDHRLKLAKCGEALIPSAARSSRRVTSVEVRCPGPQPWKLFIPVEASKRLSVVVAKNPLSRGTIISMDDVVLAERDVGALPYGYHQTQRSVVGHELRRSIGAGEVVVPDALKDAILIKRGQQVTLVSQRKGVMVKSSGTALGDGTEKQRIRVRTKSERVVEGIVENSQQVRVGL